MLEAQDESTPLLHTSVNIRSDDEDTGNTDIIKTRQVVASLVACLSAISGGMLLGYSAEALPKLQHEGLLDKEQATWFGSLVSIGAMLGGPLAAPIVSEMGRKPTAMFSALPYVIGWLFVICAENYIMLFIGRTITGIGLGMACLVIPLYTAEVSTKDIRGLLGSTFQLMVTIGILLSYSLGVFLPWRWLAIASMVPPFALVIGMFFMPETPRYLLSNGQHREARHALRRLRGANANVEKELAMIEGKLRSSGKSFTLSDFLDPSVYIPAILSCGLMFFQQFVGTNAVIFYTKDIFESAGFSGNSSLPTLVIGIVQVGATCVSCLLCDKVGRRLLLITSASFMALSCATLGLYYYLTLELGIDGLGALSLSSLVMYIIAFSLGWGPGPWLLTSELSPMRASGVISSLANVTNWLCCFILTKEFADLQKIVNLYGAFWTFGCICLLSIVFVVLFIPETKGKTLEEIETYHGKT